MSAHNATKIELISQLFWQMEIGADESLFATPCFKEKKIGLKEYFSLLENTNKSDLTTKNVQEDSLSSKESYHSFDSVNLKIDNSGPDVNEKKVLFTTVNQWFDKSIFVENTIKTLYYPSIDYKEFQKYNKKYFKKFNSYPSEITILTYDALGLIYYAWKQNRTLSSTSDFVFKNKIKGKIGTFSFKDKYVRQELNIYKIENNQFIKF